MIGREARQPGLLQPAQGDRRCRVAGEQHEPAADREQPLDVVLGQAVDVLDLAGAVRGVAVIAKVNGAVARQAREHRAQDRQAAVAGIEDSNHAGTAKRRRAFARYCST